MPKLTVWQNGIRHDKRFEGAPVLSRVLAEMGLSVPQPCGGRGRCGKCRVEARGAVSPPNALEEKAGGRLACQLVLLDNCEVTLPQSQEMAQIQLEGRGHAGALHPMAGRYGAAVDLGTTTLALKLYALSDGRNIASAARVNPQTAVAADVMGRIGAALQGELPRLERMALGALDSMVREACEKAHIPEGSVETLAITGNTTMLYLLRGLSPLALSRAPFEADHLFGEWAEILGRKAYLPPCMNAFVGADITCAALASGLAEKEETALLVDVGTNGEIALWKDGALHVASTAAGPAFEGAGIRMGLSSVPGAIDSVWLEDGRLKAHTIGDMPPKGVCGSGLIDAVAVLLDSGLIEETGRVEAERLRLAGEVYLYPADIRAVQLAKAAIAAGIRTLMHASGVKADDIHTLYIAGGFGSHLDIHSAARIGLIPRELTGKVSVIGNAALAGATELLLDTKKLTDVALIAASARHVPLGGNPWFNEAYMEEMLFPEEQQGAFRP
ncbi:MAG: ASKHA domain-containing protein [Eubacteriales bacterium]|nr:ASKHA domain-containing protein [Eubacteriales bacterium]